MMLRFLLRPAATQFNHTIAGGSLYELSIRGAKRKHLRIAARKKREAENKIKRQQKKDAGGDKAEFVPYKIRLMMQAGPPKREEDLTEHLLSIVPEDDVWLQTHHARQTYTVAQALQWHKETLESSVYDMPEALIKLGVELNMHTKQKTKFIDKIQGIVRLPHPVSDDVIRRVLAIANDAGERERAQLAGAELAVSAVDAISMFEAGEVNAESYEYFVCHGDAVLDVVRIRGLMKHQFPDKKRGTLGNDLYTLTERFAKGTEFATVHEFLVKQYGKFTMPVARVNMPYEYVQKNVKALVELLLEMRSGGGGGKFINKVEMLAEGSEEKFKVDLYECLSAGEQEAAATRKTMTKRPKKSKASAAAAAEAVVAPVDADEAVQKSSEIDADNDDDVDVTVKKKQSA